MRDCIYKNQVLAILYMETVTDKELEKYAINQYKNDYCLQQHIYGRSVVSKNYMASVQDSEIKNIALKNYPLDYDMQIYSYEKLISERVENEHNVINKEVVSFP